MPKVELSISFSGSVVLNMSDQEWKELNKLLKEKGVIIADQCPGFDWEEVINQVDFEIEDAVVSK